MIYNKILTEYCRLFPLLIQGNLLFQITKPVSKTDRVVLYA